MDLEDVDLQDQAQERRITLETGLGASYAYTSLLNAEIILVLRAPMALRDNKFNSSISVGPRGKVYITQHASGTHFN